MKTLIIRATGIILFNLFFAWLSICLIKVFLISGLFADDVMKIDLSTSELHRLRFIKEAMVDSSQDSMFIFSVILFLLAASSFACYLYMRVHLHRGDKIRDAEKFRVLCSTATVWWFSALSSVILLSLPPFTSSDVKTLRLEKQANAQVLNTLEQEKQHVDFMIHTGKLNELKDEYPKFLDNKEIQLTLDQANLSSYNFNAPVDFVPFAVVDPAKNIGLDRLQDTLFFLKNEIKNKSIELVADFSEEEKEKAVVAAGLSIRASQDTCILLEFSNVMQNGRSDKLLLPHSQQRFCIRTGETKEAFVDAQNRELPVKIKAKLTMDTVADIEISDASLALAKNYKQRYFDSAYCLEGKDLAYPKNIRSYIYIPNFSAFSPQPDTKQFSSLTCQQVVMGKKFNYPYSP